MYSKLFAQGAAHILALPIVALLLFVAVFAFIVIRTMRRGSGEFAGMAALPLESEVQFPRPEESHYG